MTRHRWILSLVAVFTLAAPIGASAQSTQPSPDEQAANTALAERLTQMAQTSLSGKTIVPATLRESAALLETATRLDPSEPRFLRLLTEAYLQLGGPEGRKGAISALERYRQIKPGDEAALVRLIDLYAGEIQTTDKGIEYVKQMLADENLPPEVRSHAAVLGAKLSIERSESEESAKYLEQALKLFPLSHEALQMQYQQLPADAPPAQRASLLLSIVRSNPVNPAAMSELASLLADAGLVDPALTWSQYSLSTAQRLGQPPNFTQITALAAEYVIADQLQTAEQLLQKLMEVDPTNADAAFLSLLIEKRGGNNEKIQSGSEKVREAVLTRLSRLSDQINNRGGAETPAASTQPSTNVDIAADVKKLAEVKDPQLSRAYAGGLADLAWLELYFNGSAAAAKQYLQPLSQLLPENSPTLARLEGWSALVNGKKDEARVKLSAVADQDPLAMLGLIRLDSAEQPADRVSAAARKLLGEHASGLVGAMLIEALRDQVGLMPPAPGAGAIRAELDKFPRDWMDFLDFQKVKNFYSLKAEPLRVGHTFGEPILARVTITNTGNYDITVGPDGAIRPDLWVDATIKGLMQKNLPGVAFDRMGQKLVVKPRESISQIMRVDQDGLAQLLSSNPTLQVPIYFSLLTNPITQQGGIAPGPGGYRVQFTRVVERSPSPLNDQTLGALYQKLQVGSGDERVRAIEQLGTFAAALKSRGKEEEQFIGKANEIIDVIRKSTGDPVPSVRAEATFVTALLSDPSVREGMVKQMLLDPQFIVRVVGLAAVQQSLPPEQRKNLVQPLAPSTQPASETSSQAQVQPLSDPQLQEIVEQMAQAVIEVAKLPPTSQPTTEPSMPEQTAGTP